MRVDSLVEMQRPIPVLIRDTYIAVPVEFALPMLSESELVRQLRMYRPLILT